MSRILLLPFSKVDPFPVELLSEIFLLIVQDWSGHRTKLMLVCRRWRAIVLSIPGIHSQLTIGRATQKEVVQAFIQGRKSRLHVRVDMNDERHGSDFNAENFRACVIAAAQAASRWSSLTLISPPPHGEYKTLQISQPFVHLTSFKLACGFGEFVEPLMTAIGRGASPNLITMYLEDPVAVLYLGQLACLHINHSLRTLQIQLSKRMDSPVDILPHLQRLEKFVARNLCLPLYSPNGSLPLIHTLRFLNLKSVSIQWMAGYVFPALEQCEIRFPHHADFVQTLQSVSMPSCSHLLYYSNDLYPLTHFHLPSLVELRVQSGQWNVWRGNPQLVALCSVVTAGAKSLTELRLEVECSEQLLLHMLNLVPALKWLSLGLARPNALRTSFFQAFIIRDANADGASDMDGPPGQTIAPLCPSLRSLTLQYRRWLRGPDRKALIVVFGNIMASRNRKIHDPFDFMLNFDEAPISSWSIDKPVRKSQDLARADLMLGISIPHGIIPISTALPRNGPVPLPFIEAEYLRLYLFGIRSSYEFRITHYHMELMVSDYDQPPLPTSLPCALPLFIALRVLVVEGGNPLFLAGHTLPKLERCRVVKARNFLATPLSRLTETVMPVCTKLDINDPYLLATFKLPQIHELAIDFLSNREFSKVWEKHIAMNAYLPGLTLLHMKNWPFGGALIPILRSFPLLETLIISSWPGVVSLEAFLPVEAIEAAGPQHTSEKGRELAFLCPRFSVYRLRAKIPRCSHGRSLFSKRLSLFVQRVDFL